ncbi:uncharacterized protein LOC142775171 [Rhipicephalus microplus]|uniref:uncharacterized protein LOC142775171 n=1 Tax=Rhipicephalus microplus TaxID=6941 RepID=UPI003F6CA935
MYACIRFQDDNHRAVVETTDFHDFSPEHKDDFENRWYEVFWHDEFPSAYFKALSVCLYASRQDTEKLGKRVPIPPPPSDRDSDTGSSDESQPKKSSYTGTFLMMMRPDRKSCCSRIMFLDGLAAYNDHSCASKTTRECIGSMLVTR